MCGIAGLVDLKGLRTEETARRCETALRRIRMRGPDGEGTWADAHCALVHTRLAIIDLSPLGAQPMRRGGLSITFNGEIFNYAELRDELARLGHSFQSHSDTEVLLAGWQQWGAELLPRLNGMFAFAIWDAEARTLFAARDRFGEKPLVYAQSGERLAFGTDLIACEAMLGETRPVDPAALRALFTLRFVPEPWSIARGVRKLPAGHWLRFGPRGLVVEPWYELTAARTHSSMDIADIEAGLRQRLDLAVQARLVSDVPVGVFLSSGIDSALVAASVAASGGRLKTFTVGFQGASGYYEERPMAAAVARHLGAEHNEIEVSGERVGEVLDRVFTALDEPFADASAVPTFLVSEATSRKVKVVLTGDGADEVFGGYRRYWSELHAGLWNRLPGALRAALTGLAMRLPEGKDSRLMEALRRVRRFAATADADPVRRQAALMRLASEQELDRLLERTPDEPISLESLVLDRRAASSFSDPINAMLACDVSLGLPGDMLVKVDRTSMANALETRTPYLDDRVVEWAFALPGSQKLALMGGRPVGKRILRSAFRDRLPAEVFTRPKRGFEMPVAAMLNGPAAERLAAATETQALARQGLFNPGQIAAWSAELASGRRDTSWQLWTLLAFQEWARLHRRPEALP
ncbi:asparagine synthase (glutamine-hydrolyzing) [Rhodoplanes sp. Z2-YC6860]|uniref:asparagine synthase (glutamine-hydrolyzing) n=1 Tax=Rhodoplanes sp. Z2-YC6860 TaxID=674703 RepID=UPI00078EAB30|nr:asparagine synthase (glutamine-hydrolyzing) [Rhodoplanes sp. Z2-YC6860]AMN43430.1 asparagine synthase [Rhodoplanes sp. Z2-YC6860]